MKLESLTIRNFRGYRDETEIKLDDLTAFIGKNDAGKSTVLEALEIFFNNSLVVCEKDDLAIGAQDRQIEISCAFSGIPRDIVIDAANPTTLSDEYLLTDNGHLKISKVFSATAAKPKEKIFIHCSHPSVDGCADLLELKRADLRSRAASLGVSSDSYNANVNASIRQAIREHVGELGLVATKLLIDKEDTKKIYDTIKAHLPIYALFQSDRQSRDDDKEVADPMKIAVQQALGELGTELDHIKAEVRAKAIEAAHRTLVKLQEMAPDLAKELIPEFKVDPKFDSQFKLTIKSEDEIAINKRGSGVRRLVLLNFFRAEAERRIRENVSGDVIYAFEEPETSQHPDHQEILMTAFLELASAPSSQIILTTHTPALAAFLPLSSLRFINRNGHARTIEFGTEEVFEKVADTLGVLPHPIPKDATAMLLVEGAGDVVFVNHTAQQLKSGGYIKATFEERRIAIVPIGGCGNVKHWRTKQLASQFGIPYCVLLDSDLGTNEEEDNRKKVAELQADNIKAYVTRKREPENYICLDCLNLSDESELAFTDTDDAKALIQKEKGGRKNMVLEDYWVRMSCDQIREAERYQDGDSIRYEFTDMFNDFLSLTDEKT